MKISWLRIAEELGNSNLDLAKMYLEDKISISELASVIGSSNADLVNDYKMQQTQFKNECNKKTPYGVFYFTYHLFQKYRFHQGFLNLIYS